MSELESSFAECKPKNCNLLILLWNRTHAELAVESEARKAFDELGYIAKGEIRVAQHYWQDSNVLDLIRKEIVDKNWPGWVRPFLEKEIEPLAIILDSDFESFDPISSRWAILRLKVIKENGQKNAFIDNIVNLRNLAANGQSLFENLNQQRSLEAGRYPRASILLNVDSKLENPPHVQKPVTKPGIFDLPGLRKAVPILIENMKKQKGNVSFANVARKIRLWMDEECDPIPGYKEESIKKALQNDESLRLLIKGRQ